MAKVNNLLSGSMQILNDDDSVQRVIKISSITDLIPKFVEDIGGVTGVNSTHIIIKQGKVEYALDLSLISSPDWDGGEQADVTAALTAIGTYT